MERYRSLNIKLTPQRLAILKYLDGNKTHPSAEQIYRAVKQEFPTMSFATVYNTLEALHDKGFIRELHIDPGKRRYDPNATPHHHFVCLACNDIIDVHENFQVQLSDESAQGCSVAGINIEFYGTCQQCR